MPQRHFRVRNNTTDQTTIRIEVIHLDPNISAIFDVAPGQTQQKNHMKPGSRGVIIYDDFQKTVIATGSFWLEAFNVGIHVGGSAAAEYAVYFDTFTDPANSLWVALARPALRRESVL